MTFDIPSSTRQDSYLPIPPAYEEALQKAKAQFEAQNDPAKESDWEDAGEREDVKLFKKTNPENAYDVPIVKGVTIVENATPSQVLAVIQQPGMRKKWDSRFDAANQLERYGPQKYLFYTYMKSPSYFVWARDIVGVQENIVTDNGDRIVVIQTSVDDKQYVDEDGSYSKSRTRAALEVSAWDITKQGNNTKLEYVVKIHLNGSLPTSVVSAVATDTPMCVGCVRDVYYQVGHLPYDSAQDEGEKSAGKSILVYSEFEDGDGTEATSGEKRWTIWYQATGAETIKIRYDNQRLYTSLNVAVEGDAKDDVKASIDKEAGIVTVDVGEGATGKQFSLVFTP
ncbi:uncharacterized protein UBRO_02672 [Ustilago bromivora]|uniref:START domain-containing protein n=1 Tax=Ustilago bromivora TaxID=307758 RepID=A0A1K0G1M7_9BASI|nr:uncharacterized protein UBRO_02672 [Ustilago bromivora]SYW76985.1 uncharacterized protein UBRO2_01608 [Ustilago bromivora]